MVEALNAKADGQVMPAVRGSVAWVIAEYKDTDEYKALKKGSLKYYNRFLKDLETLFGPLPFKDAMTRRVTVDFVRSYKKGMRRQAGAVLVNVFNTALYHQCADVNHAHKLKIKGGQPREQTYSEKDIQAWLRACDDPAMHLAFTILRFAVQRPGDVLAMTWAQYNGDTIKLRQEKTGKLVEVPCHAELRAALDEAKKTTKSLYIVSDNYRRLSYGRFGARFRVIADAAGLDDHQARDLRRSAAVRMAEAGATVIQISAIAGWSIEYTTRILETYIPRNVEMARGAVAKWEQKKAKSLTSTPNGD
jgi:integrase